MVIIWQSIAERGIKNNIKGISKKAGVRELSLPINRGL